MTKAEILVRYKKRKKRCVCALRNIEQNKTERQTIRKAAFHVVARGWYYIGGPFFRIYTVIERGH